MSNSNSTVLIITSHFPPNIGGVESHLQALVDGLVEKNWQVIISTYQPLASPKKAPAVEKQKNKIIYRQKWPGFNLVHKLTPYPILELLYLFPGLFLGTLNVLRKYNTDISVIHCQGLVPTVIGVMLGRIFSKRVIASTHNLYFFPLSGLYSLAAKQIFSRVDKILVPTEIAKTELLRIGIPLQKIGFFRYWIDLNRFTPSLKTRAKERLKWQGFSVLFVGRLIPTKGVLILLDTIKSLRGKVKLIIAGDGALNERVKKAQQAYPEKINFLGRIENTQLPLYYSGADIVVVPSTVDEGWGFVVMEAVACGTPVIASNKGGLSDAVSPLIGRLVPANAPAFKKALEFFYQNQTERIKLQVACRKYASTHFGKENIKDIIHYYESSN